MANKNITVKEKQSDGTYTSYYPKNHAQNVERTTQNISYIAGNTLLEVMQNIANAYIAPKAEKWYKITKSKFSTFNNTSKMCVCDDFIAVFTPYNSGTTHQMNMAVSYNGGDSWEFGSFSNTNSDTYINVIMGVIAKRASVGNYEVIITGQANASATNANTYKIKFSKFGSAMTVYESVEMFTNKIPLGGV